jgi:hypothetical protein
MRLQVEFVFARGRGLLGPLVGRPWGYEPGGLVGRVMIRVVDTLATGAGACPPSDRFLDPERAEYAAQAVSVSWRECDAGVPSW